MSLRIKGKHRILISKLTIVSLIILLSPLSNLMDKMIQNRGGDSLQLLLVLLMGTMVSYEMRKKNTSVRLNGVLFLAVLNVGYLLALWVMKGSGLNRITQFLIMIFVLCIIKEIHWEDNDVVYLARLMNAMIILNLLWIPFTKHILKFSGFYNNSNSLGCLCICALYFTLIQKRDQKKVIFKKLAILLDCIVLLLSGSRASILASAFLMFGYFFRDQLIKKNNKKLFYVLFFVIIVTGVAVVYVLPDFRSTEIGRVVEDFSTKYFGKTIYSGRQYIWKHMVSLSQNDPIFGLGLSTTFSAVKYGDARSAHSLYLQTIVQSGYVGLVLLMLFLFSIYKATLNRWTEESTLTVFLILSMLIHEMFEVSLTQNNWDQGIVFWLIMGLGLSNLTLKRQEVDSTNEY